MFENGDIELKRVLLGEMEDWIVPVVSLVSDPSVPLARFVSIKSAQGGKAMKKFPVDGLARLRKAHGLTQVQVSTKSGIPQSTLSALETGQFALTAENAVRLARAVPEDPATLEFVSHLVAMKARTATGDPRAALYAAQTAYDLAQDEGLTEEQRELARILCADLLRTVEDDLGVDPKQAVDELPAATRSAELDSGRDEFGRPTDPNRDLKISRGM